VVTLRFVLVGLTIVGTFACRTLTPDAGPTLVQPGAPGLPTRAVDADQATDTSRVGFDEADVRFVRGMIGHHAQAIEMTDLLTTRTGRDDMRMLAKRIEASQTDEIVMMEQWLDGRGQARPRNHGHGDPGSLMPGMLSAGEMARLAAASGEAFDRLFLDFMIKHHEGALSMVLDLFSTPGAAQESDIFAFASDVEADQRMEIRRMQIMLAELVGTAARD
jgi:uncharacterized protein (DUF305 family)